MHCFYLLLICVPGVPSPSCVPCVHKPNRPSSPHNLQLLCNILQGGNMSKKKRISTEITFHTSKMTRVIYWERSVTLLCKHGPRARIKRLPFHISANVRVFKFVGFLRHQARERCASRGHFLAVFVATEPGNVIFS